MGSLFGSLMVVLLTVSIAKTILSKFLKGGFALYAPYLLSMVFVTVLGAYGLADGHSPQWKAAFFSYLPGHLIWLLYDLLKPKRFPDAIKPAIICSINCVPAVSL